MLRNAGLAFTIEVPSVDEEAAKSALLSDGAGPCDVADALAELKAATISARNPRALVIGCDQVLEFEGRLLSKPVSASDAMRQLGEMRGHSHELLSAAVICEGGEPVWRHVGQVRLGMRSVSDAYLSSYVARNWNSIRDSIGAYKLEEEGVRLIDSIDGDYFHVLGMPLLELLKYLSQRGVLQT
jgi:septum formation protein